jgi:hypothetical protein
MIIGGDWYDVIELSDNRIGFTIGGCGRSRSRGRHCFEQVANGHLGAVGISLLVTTHLRMAEEGSILSFLVAPRLYPLLQLSGLTSILNIRVIQGSEH